MRANFKRRYDASRPDTVEDTDEVRLNCDVEHWETDVTIDNRGVPLPTGPTTVAHSSASVLGRGGTSLSLVELLGRAAEREEEEELAAAIAMKKKPWERASLKQSSRASTDAPRSAASAAAALPAAPSAPAASAASSGRKRTARPTAAAQSFATKTDPRKRARN